LIALIINAHPRGPFCGAEIHSENFSNGTQE